jgi:tellurite resistance protein TerA
MVMTVLRKGANAAVPTGRLRVVAGWQRQRGTPEPDLVAVLLAADGTVRSDADLVFYNQPSHPSTAVTLVSAGDTGALHVDLAAIEPGVASVVLAVARAAGTLAGIAGLHLLVQDGTGSPVLRYDVTDTAGLCAVVLGELYRRGPVWKFRAVGQGWSNGLAGLVNAYGVAVDNHPAESLTTPAPAPQPCTDRPSSHPGTPPSYRGTPPAHPGSPPAHPGSPPASARSDEIERVIRDASAALAPVFRGLLAPRRRGRCPYR